MTPRTITWANVAGVCLLVALAFAGPAAAGACSGTHEVLRSGLPAGRP